MANSAPGFNSFLLSVDPDHKRYIAVHYGKSFTLLGRDEIEDRLHYIKDCDATVEQIVSMLWWEKNPSASIESQRDLRRFLPGMLMAMFGAERYASLNPTKSFKAKRSARSNIDWGIKPTRQREEA